MKRSYAFSRSGVFYHIDWPLIQEYFDARKLRPDLPSLENEVPNVDALCAEIRKLPAEQQTDIDQDVRDIYDLADEPGMRLLYEEARFHGRDLTELLTDLGYHDMAMWALLHQPTLFAEVLCFHAADASNKRCWHRRRGVGQIEPDTSEAGQKRLSSQITDYLLSKEGRGKHCHVEMHRRSTGFLFVTYPEDYGDTLLEYVEDKLVRHKYRPARDILFFYSPDKGMLEIFCQGKKDRVHDLQEIFAWAILGVVLAPDERAEKAYRLNRLKERDFFFPIDPSTGLVAMGVRSICLRDRDGGRPLTIDVGGPAGVGVLFAVEKYFETQPGARTDKYPLALMDVHKARLQATFHPVGKQRRGRTQTFTLNLNGCPLDQEGTDGVIRKVLVDSGLEYVHELALA